MIKEKQACAPNITWIFPQLEHMISVEKIHTHHVESISQFTWNPLKNGKCQSWNSSISSNIRRMLSNIKYLLRRGPSTKSPRTNSRKSVSVPSQPAPALQNTSVHALSMPPPAHTKETQFAEMSQGLFLPFFTHVASQVYQNQSLSRWFGDNLEPWVCFWAHRHCVHSCFPRCWNLSFPFHS